MKVRLPSHGEYFRVAGVVRAGGLHTICESARCPNIGECWERRTATFLILGDVCTRNCGFCAVAKGTPLPPDPGEPARVAEAAVRLGLRYAVITSVTRDDLADGGAAHFAAVIRAVREARPGTRVEALIPDFGGDEAALGTVLDASPDVLNHNLETTESLYPAIRRPRGNYGRSLGVLAAAKARGARTKSGLMIGLGESEPDILRTFADLRRAGCDLLTVGQYLQPTAAHPPVVRYYTPEEFEALAAEARRAGFREVVAGPLVRSSYEAGRLFDAVREKDGAPCAT
ncbi:MAG: lipoyl synthase [Candidatus Aminicenantes bacterium]|nr:lipoyl synthase [Candidatus Aminicenantes bacterium]NLH77035.1 lipoyl synthase [Acidobacteriota bacterium]